MKRVLLKLSGEALCANTDGILNFEFISDIAQVIKKCLAEGVEIAVIVGAGNIWRGRQGGKMDRVRADRMGMLATTINSLALQDTFIQEGIDAVVMSAVEMSAYADKYTTRDAVKALKGGKVVIFAGGLFLINGQIDPGEFAAFLLYISMFLNPIRRIVTLVEQMQDGMSGFERFVEMICIDVLIYI